MSQATASSNQSNSLVFSFGDSLDLSKSNGDESCIACGRKVGNKPWFVHVSFHQEILHPASTSETSQGFWAVGSECAKKFDSAVLIKF